MAMESKTDLVKAIASSLTILPTEEEPTIFQKFRFVFRAEWCSYRKVYWYDHKWGRTRLWQVLKPDRVSKKEDDLIGIFEGEPDADVLRLAIANANKYKLLTGVRWELYADFECRDFVAMGRFDFLDLCPLDKQKLQHLVERNIVGVSRQIADWDFDAIFLTHRCPKCGKFFAKDFLIFAPEMMKCWDCNYSSADIGAASHNEKIIFELMRMISEKDKGRFVVERQTDVPVEVFFIDIAATAVICFLIKTVFHGGPVYKSLGVLRHYPIEQIVNCFQKSVFPKLNNELLRELFCKTFKKHYQREKTAIKRGRPIYIFHDGISEAEHRQWLIKSIREMEKNFAQAIDGLIGLEDWFLFTRSEDYNKMIPAEAKKKTSGTLKAVDDFAQYLELLLELIWQKEMEVKNARHR